MLKSLLSGRNLVCELALLALLIIPSHAHACDELVTAGPDSDCVEGVKHAGNTGTWFERTKADEVKRKLRIYKELELQVEKFSFTNALYEKETAALRQTVTLMEDSARAQQKQIELANKDAREAREAYESSNRWYKSPLFWGITMFIVGAAVQHACCSGK